MLSAPVGDSGTNHDKGGVPVSDLPVPTAARLQRPRWRDVRLVVGVALVLASVVLGSWVVARADDRVPMYAARAALVPGQRLTQDDLVRVDVQLGAQGQRYLSAGSALAPDRFVVREVREGELVPRAAVGGQDDVGVQALTLMVDSGVATVLRVGSRVDVYVNAPSSGAAAGSTRFAGPELALEGVSVSGVPQGSGGLGGSAAGEQPVQVMAPTERIKGVIGEVDRGARVTLVPVAGSSLQGSR